ncbi:MAG: protein kinase [Pyrinomonadaceae bacterium]
MDHAIHEKAKSLFDDAIKRDPVERALFVEAASSGDVELRRAVDALIDLFEQEKLANESPADCETNTATLFKNDPIKPNPEEQKLFIEAAGDDDVEFGPRADDLIRIFELGNINRTTAGLSPAAGPVSDSRIRKGQMIGHFQVISTIGKGGQGTVYKVLDTKLNRTLALKFLPHELMANETNVRRFQREAELASSLDHPNICTIHDLLEVDGKHLIVMQFVEGMNIRKLVDGEPLEIRTAVKIGIQVCDALAAAHGKGIIHRDIKAQNVIITETGKAKVLDFGLAKIIGDRAPDSTELTVAGVAYGTPTYAAPEQSTGDKVDHRADIFSTGVLLFEMLAGTWPFQGKTSVDVRHAVLHDDPISMEVKRGQPLPEGLEPIILKALAKAPKDRYQRIAEMRDDLMEVLTDLPESDTSETARFLSGFESVAPRRLKSLTRRGWLIAAALSVLILVAAGSLAYLYLAGTGRGPINSVAVMPFASSGDTEIEFLSDGLSETLMTSLSGIPNLQVKARSSAGRLKGTDLSPNEIGQKLNVEAILNGQMSLRGDKLTLDLELVDTQTENIVWRNRYDRNKNDLVSLQVEITRDISRKLRPAISGDQLAKKRQPDPKAFELYLNARYHTAKLARHGIQLGMTYYQQAIEADPSYADAYVGLANAYRLIGVLGEGVPDEHFPKAKAAGEKAVEIDPENAGAYAILGLIQFYYEWDWPAAESKFIRALELDPNNYEAKYGYSFLLSYSGRHDESLAMIAQLKESEPLDLPVRSLETIFLHNAGKYDDALARSKKLAEMDRTYWLAYHSAGEAYLAKGMYKEAIAETRRATELSPEQTWSAAYEVAALARSGDRAGALDRTQHFVELSKTRYVPPYHIAMMFGGMGDDEQAFVWLKKSLEMHDPKTVRIKVDPIWNDLRNDPRFQEVAARMGAAKTGE